MPVYEYLCDECGPFTDMRPMSECDDPQECPTCAVQAPRVILTAPAFASMRAEVRQAHATNERSRHAPMTLDQYKNTKHGAGCSCCSTSKKPSRLVARGRNGSKSFPTARPWMISH